MSYKLFWGDLHNHCSISYGHGTVEQALMRARPQLDFCSITGHAFWPDMPTDRSVYGDIIDYHNEGFATLARNWSKLLRLQSAGTTDGEFIVFPSYEWHSLQFGDHNVYGMNADLPLVDAPDLPSLREVVGRVNGIAIPHHIGYRAGYRGINWAAYQPDRSPFVEIFSLHGCSLSDPAPYPMLHDMGPRDTASTAEAGWQLGHRFGIVGGTDHHAAYPGSHGDGRMGVFSTELTRESLWEAFAHRRVYAATGDRIDARMLLNDAWIGDSVKAPDRRQVRINVAATDAIDRAELLKNGHVVERWFPTQVEPAAKRHRYKLRITWGWGRKSVPVSWQGQLSLSEGDIIDVETCFSGQAIVSPKQTAGDEQADVGDLPHELLDQQLRQCAWRSVTQGNKSMRHETSQALSLEIEAPLQAKLSVVVNNERFTYPLDQLLRRSHSHFLRGWLSEAICIGPLVPIEQCKIDAQYVDQPDGDVDVYRLQVAQLNGQWAWLTPVWADR